MHRILWAYHFKNRIFGCKLIKIRQIEAMLFYFFSQTLEGQMAKFAEYQQAPKKDICKNLTVFLNAIVFILQILLKPDGERLPH